MTDNNELLVQKIDFVLSDPEAFFSEESARALSFVRAALAQRQGEPVYAYTEQQIADACAEAEIPDSKCQSLLIALQEAGTAPATAEHQAEFGLTEQAIEWAWRSGWRHCRDAETVGSEAENEEWWFDGANVVQVAQRLAAATAPAPVAEALIDALARIKHCTQHVGDDLARTIRGIGFIADAAIASTKKDSTS